MGALWIATILAGWVGYVSNDFWEGKYLAPWGFKTMGSPGGRPYRPPVPLFGEIIGGALLPRPSELSVAGRWDQMIANWRFCIKIQHRPRSSSFCGEWTNPMVFTKDRPGPKSLLWKKGRIWLSHLVATEPILPGIGKKRERYILIHLKIVHNFHSCWSSKAATFWPLCTICSNWAKDLGRKWPHQILVQLARSNTSWNTLLMNEWMTSNKAWANLTDPQDDKTFGGFKILHLVPQCPVPRHPSICAPFYFHYSTSSYPAPAPLPIRPAPMHHVWSREWKLGASPRDSSIGATGDSNFRSAQYKTY